MFLIGLEDEGILMRLTGLAVNDGFSHSCGCGG